MNTFNQQWKQYLHSRKLRILPDFVPPTLRFEKEQTDEQRLKSIRQSHAKRFLGVAEMLRSRRYLEAAIIEYEKAQKILGTRNELVANSLARSYLEISKPRLAIAALAPVLEYYPELPGPQVTMGVAYLQQGNARQAQEHLQVALRINPFDPEIHCTMALALKDRRSKDAKLYASLCEKLQP
jgi:tetratricopeptide (TPR) repeat protein